MTRVALLLLGALGSAAALTFTIEPNKEECFFEEINKGEKVSTTFQVASGGFLDIDVKVTTLQRAAPAAPTRRCRCASDPLFPCALRRPASRHGHICTAPSVPAPPPVIGSSRSEGFCEGAGDGGQVPVHS